MKKSLFLAVAMLLMVVSCKKDAIFVPVENELVAKAKAYHAASAQVISRNGEDSLSIFQVFNLDWTQARVASKDLKEFVIVPLAFDEQMKEVTGDSLIGDMVFYEDGTSIFKEIWIQSTANTYIDNKHEALDRGACIVLNERHWSAQ